MTSHARPTSLSSFAFASASFCCHKQQLRMSASRWCQAVALTLVGSSQVSHRACASASEQMSDIRFKISDLRFEI